VTIAAELDAIGEEQILRKGGEPSAATGSSMIAYLC
jgi:hypothetical protein